MPHSSKVQLLVALVLSIGMLAQPVWASGAGAPAPDSSVSRPRRIISLCLPGDQLLLQLAKREEIAAISWLACDPELSPHWEEAAGVPTTRGLAEELIALQPDLVFVGTYTTPVTKAVLERLKVPVVEIGVPADFEELRALFHRAATALGPEAEAKGTAILEKMDRRLAALEARHQGRPPRTALFYFQDGYSPGTGTFADALLKAAGYRNLGTELATPGAVSLPLEQALLARPDLILFATYHEKWPTFRETGIRHPLFRQLAVLHPEVKVLAVPFRQLDCPDPMNLDMLEALP